jgi:hypothetical protein
VRRWSHLHLRTARFVEVSLIQIIRHGASGKARDPRVSWFVWHGDQPAPLAEVSPTYRSLLTLGQVRRAMPTLLHELGTPARPPQLRGKAPGRAKGFHPTPRTRQAVIRKTSKKPKKSKKITSA